LSGDEPSAVAERIAEVLDGNPLYQLRKRILRDYTWTVVYKNKIAPLLAED
jgi:hypothetical protein